MSAIPVPVHFDGHNINIITEDSPSTCKNRVKGMKYGKGSPNTKKEREWRDRRINNIQNGKYHNLNKTTFPLKASPSLSHSPSPNKMSSPVPDANSENTPHQKGKQQQETINNDDMKEQSPNSVKNIGNDDNKVKSKLNSSAKPWIMHSSDDQKQQSMDSSPVSLKKQSVLDLVSPSQNNQDSENNHSNLYKINPALNDKNVGNDTSTTAPRNMPRASIGNKATTCIPVIDINQQNKQLMAAGFDPAEFGSHDDVGFDDEESGGKQDRQNLYKTELCREWSMSGWCYYNKRCSFAHGLQELRPVFRSKKWRTKRCRNWHTTGYCPYEHRCQFLHDQSPPRRISDYATANARALVAAQQRMQPLYFHYQVDCDREDANDDENAEAKKQQQAQPQQVSKSPSPGVINAPLDARVGPRLRKQQAGRTANIQRSKYQMVKKNADGALQKQLENTRSAKRGNAMMPPRKSHHQKKQHKEPVITPFNPISDYNEQQQQNYDIAAQHLGMYNPNQVPPLGSLPPLPTTLRMTTYNPALPTSIDPSLYLSLTPSPPNSPDTQKLAKQTLNPEVLNVDVPVSLTPSPSSLAMNAAQNNQDNTTKNRQDMETLSLKIQQLSTGRSNAQQQANISALMQRGGDLNNNSSSNQNKAQTPMASLDGLMLQSLLPNDEFVELQKLKKDDATTTTSKLTLKPSSSQPNDGKTSAPIPPIPPPLQLQTSINSVVNGAVDAAMTPSTRLVPITPTVQQLAAANNNTQFSFASAANESIPNTVPTALSSASAMNGTVDPNQYLLASQPLAYSQQAHAHAHAYAAAQAHVASAQYGTTATPTYGQTTFPLTGLQQPMPLSGVNGMPLQQMPLTGLQYPSLYAASPDFPDIPQQTAFYQNHYNPPPRHNRY